mmetsp:Transcript_23527/g.39955  ORF Transcript_23527/g.39955 Transcript_23527/m.39955 type:complete len:388 (+) Transcript_23527:135-1298(+)
MNPMPPPTAHVTSRVDSIDDDSISCDNDDVSEDLEMATLLGSEKASLQSDHTIKLRTIHFHHLVSRLQPSKLLYFDTILSPISTRVVITIVFILYIGIVFRYVYLRVIDQPSDIVAYLMIHILLQMGMELYSKVSFMFMHGDKVLNYQRLQISFGWKSMFLFVTLVLVCVITVHGTIVDFNNQYTSRSLEMMILWRFFLAFFCLLMANDNTHQASLYYENFFIRNVKQQVYLSSTIDLKSHHELEYCSSRGNIDVVEKSSDEVILARIKVLMPTFVSLYQILTVKSIFNVINSAIFFILSIGFIGHSQANGMFYFNVYMIMVMSVISYTSFETITRFNTVMDLIERASSLKLHLHVRVSSYAVDDRFLTLTTGAALLQVVLKSLGVS